MEIHDIKIIAATLVFVGIILGLINQLLAPETLELINSKKRPGWLPWVSWGVTALASILYIVLDFI